MENFTQPLISPTDFFNGLDLGQQQPLHPGPRGYKSRKYRPCDFCRNRQVACKIDESPPCTLCSTHGKQCTFVERPKKKRRPNSTSNGEPSGAAQQFDPSIPPHRSPSFGEYNIEQHASFNGLNGLNGLNGHPLEPSPENQLHLGQAQDGSPIYNMEPWLHTDVRIRPLDSQATRSARFVGETGESNPYLLRRYQYDENDECTISKLTYRRIKSSSQSLMLGEKGEPPVVFMLADDSLAQKGEPRVEDDVLRQAYSDIDKWFSEKERLRLIGLFFRFVYPAFPILSRSEMYPNGMLAPNIIRTLPLSLLSAIYATALPFIIYDDLLATTLVHSTPPAHQLFRISWISVTQELHTPRLATLQACLLLLQRAPTNRYTTDTPWKNSLVGWTVSLAQTLGLSKECSDWTSIPTWEMTLRKRLWYGVFIMDKWASLGAGMPSHIRKDDFDVLPLTDNDLEAPTIDPHSNSIPGFLDPETDSNHFRFLSELTIILSDIMDSYYSIRAAQRTSKNLKLSFDLAKPIRNRLKGWKDSLPPSLALRQPERIDSRGMTRLSANPSLSLAYIVAHMTLIRALLRPLENTTNADGTENGIAAGRVAVRTAAREVAKDAVEFLETLPKGALDAFWHSWSRANFAIASSFLIHLRLSADTDSEYAEINNLMDRWRWVMRSNGGNNGNGLMSLGLLRLDGVLLENGAVHPG